MAARSATIRNWPRVGGGGMAVDDDDDDDDDDSILCVCRTERVRR